MEISELKKGDRVSNLTTGAEGVITEIGFYQVVVDYEASDDDRVRAGIGKWEYPSDFALIGEALRGMSEEAKPNYFVGPQTPTVYFDCDDTLVMWSPSEKSIKEFKLTTVPFQCGGVLSYYYVNPHNVQLLIDYAQRGHSIVVWSGAGVAWAKSVVEGLEIGAYVDAVLSKPHIFVDDVSDPRAWMGKHQYINLKGEPTHPFPEQNR